MEKTWFGARLQHYPETGRGKAAAKKTAPKKAAPKKEATKKVTKAQVPNVCPSPAADERNADDRRPRQEPRPCADPVPINQRDL